MSGELVGFSGGGGLSRDARRASRHVGQLKLNGQISTVEADEATNLAMAKVENLTMATGSAMQQITRVAAAARALEATCPEVSGRLAFLAEDHTLACAELLGDLRRNLRRVR